MLFIVESKLRRLEVRGETLIQVVYNGQFLARRGTRNTAILSSGRRSISQTFRVRLV